MVISQTFRYLAAALAGILIAAPVAFWFGARVGVREFQLADAKYRASIVAHKLGQLQRQDFASVESGMQIELNSQLANHGRHLQSKWRWMWPELESATDGEIRYAAKFRIENTFEEPDMSSPASWKPGIAMTDPFIVNVVEGQRQGKALVAMVLDQYGK